MSLFDDVAKRDNTSYLQASDYTTGEHIIFSQYSGYMLFDGVVHDADLIDEITDAIRNAERIAYKEALKVVQRKLEAHVLTFR